MARKNDEKSKEELTCRSKIDKEFDKFWLKNSQVTKIYT